MGDCWIKLKVLNSTACWSQTKVVEVLTSGQTALLTESTALAMSQPAFSSSGPPRSLLLLRRCTLPDGGAPRARPARRPLLAVGC